MNTVINKNIGLGDLHKTHKVKMEIFKTFIVDQSLCHNPPMTNNITLLFLTVCGRYYLSKRSATGQCEIAILEQIPENEAKELIGSL